MIFLLLSLLGGIIFLSVGAEALVRGSSTLAHRTGVSPLLIGLTLVAWGTSMPEFITMLQSVARGVVPLTVGNLIGANILSIFVLLGACAFIHPLKVDVSTINRHGLFLLLVTAAAVAVFIVFPVVPRYVGFIALTLLALYTSTVYRQEKARPVHHPKLPEHIHTRGLMAHPLTASALTAAGLLGLTVGASLLVDAATQLAVIFGLSQTIIGLTVVAVGTTLPELFAAVVAALHKQPGMAVGTVIGSNIFNLLGIMGTASALTPLTITPSITHLAMWAMLAAAAALFIYARGTLGRLEGALFLAAYAVYTALLLA